MTTRLTLLLTVLAFATLGAEHAASACVLVDEEVQPLVVADAQVAPEAPGPLGEPQPTAREPEPALLLATDRPAWFDAGRPYGLLLLGLGLLVGTVRVLRGPTPDAGSRAT